MIHAISDKYLWNEKIKQFKGWDLYHTYEYHKASQLNDGGEPRLYVYKSESGEFCLPLLKRQIPNEILFDLTSVYGYPGPLVNGSISAQDEEAFISFLKNNEQCVSLFSRCNTFSNNELFRNSRYATGSTVSIDLNASEKEQFQKYRSNHRRDVRNLIKKGFTCQFMSFDRGIDDFMAVYNKTMEALGASNYYFFSKDYYQSLFDNDLSELKLVRCTRENSIACVGIFSFTNGVVQYHLGGTSADYYKFAPTKLMFDFVRKFASSEGYHSFHLGGGLGGSDDNLFKFKAGFSDDIREFHMLKIVLNDLEYRRLSQGKEQSQFFPLYRA